VLLVPAEPDPRLDALDQPVVLAGQAEREAAPLDRDLGLNAQDRELPQVGGQGPYRAALGLAARRALGGAGRQQLGRPERAGAQRRSSEELPLTNLQSRRPEEPRSGDQSSGVGAPKS
jgi:hypothetical protein